MHTYWVKIKWNILNFSWQKMTSALRVHIKTLLPTGFGTELKSSSKLSLICQWSAECCLSRCFSCVSGSRSPASGSGSAGPQQGSGGDGERWGTGGPVMEDLNEQIICALARLQEDMQSVLERLHTLEALTAAQVTNRHLYHIRITQIKSEI